MNNLNDFRGKKNYVIFEQTFNMKYKVSLSFLAVVIFSVVATAQVQKINTFAGNGVAGFYGDGINASGAKLWGPTDVALDNSGNVYILDYNNYRIRKVNSIGLITTIAGTGTPGNPVNGTLGTSANITANSIAVGKHNTIYFSDAVNHVIRKIDSAGFVYKVAGKGTPGYSGDGGKADTARFTNPQGIAVDDKGNIYIADAGNNVVRMIDTLGFISTIAGTGVAGYFGDMGLATFAELDSPYSVAVDHIGNVYINDFNNGRIRMIDNTGTITTAVGTGLFSYTGDMGLAVNATINYPRGLAVDTNNNLYIADALNNVVRKVDGFGIITTAAGNGTFGYGGDLGFVTGANFKNPYGVAVDVYGGIYIADANNQRIRKTYATLGVGGLVASAGVDEYPNPCSDKITLSGLTSADKISVCDMTGRKVSETWQSSSDEAQTFDIHTLPAGVYVVHVIDRYGYNKAVLKLVKD